MKQEVEVLEQLEIPPLYSKELVDGINKSVYYLNRSIDIITGLFVALLMTYNFILILMVFSL